MRSVRAFAPALLWAALVWLIGGLTTVPAAPGIRGLDKVVHFGLYGVLGWLCGRGWLAVGGPGLAVLVVALALLLGVGDELRQAHVPGRVPELADWIADAAGVLTGFLLAVGWARWRRRTN